MGETRVVSGLATGDWFRDPLEDRLWLVEGMEKQGDEVHVFYSRGPEDSAELSEAVYDGSALVYIADSVEASAAEGRSLAGD